MKKRKKQIAKFLKLSVFLFGFSLLLWNCEKDEVIEKHFTEEKTTSFSFNKINDLKNDDLFKTAFDNYQKEIRANQSFKQEKTESLDIDTENILKVHNKETTSYIFRIGNQDTHKVFIKNLILQINENKDNRAFIVDYDISNFDVLNQNKFKLKGKIKASPISTSKVKGYLSKVSTVEETTYTLSCTGGTNGNCNGASHSPGEQCYAEYSSCISFSPSSITVYYSNDGNTSSSGSHSGSEGQTTSDFSGGTITPNATNYEIKMLLLNSIKECLTNLSQEESSFLNSLNNRELQTFNSFLQQDNCSTEAQAYAKGQIELETLTQDSNRNWKPSTGIIANNPHLKYTHSDRDADRAYFKMEDGSIIVTSGEEQTLTGSGDLTNKYRENAGVDFGEFYYIKLPGQQWAEMLFNPNSLGDDLKTLFALAGKDIGVNLGRYVLPIEDIKILIDGKDFDGQDVARWKAAGGILLTVVPGGKIVGTGAKVLRPVLKIADNVASWSKVIKWGNRTYKLKYEVINGVINYGDRSQLARILKTTSNIEAHHIIPWAKCNHTVVEAAARAGFHPNMVKNGLGLQKYTKLIGEGLHGNHPAYDDFILHKLNVFGNSTFNPESASSFLLKDLIPELKTLIINAKNSGMNLNEYFKKVVNPSNGIPNY